MSNRSSPEASTQREKPYGGAGEPSTVVVATTPGQAYGRVYLGWILLLVFLINVFNLTDRLVMGILLQPIKKDFGLTDLQLGLLSGLAFTVIYASVGIPLGSAADRINRRNLVGVCVGFWSAMTVLTGLATGYIQMMFTRAGVALGESGFAPAIQSMLSDFFPPRRRAMALAVWGLGAPIGALVGNTLGGFAAQDFGWRAAFFIVGLPGFLLAILFLITIREPLRGNTETREDSGATPGIATAIAFAFKARSIRYLMFGAGAHLFVFYGLSIWLAPFLIRLHHLSLGMAGLWIGVITGVFGGAGTLLGGYISDQLSRRNIGWYAWFTALCLFLMLPFGAGMYLWPVTDGALAFGCGVALLGAIWAGPTFAVVQLVSPLRMRGVVASVLIFTQNMIGLGLGPLAVGWLSDAFKPYVGAESIRWAMLSVFFFEIAAVVLYINAGRWISHDLHTYAGRTTVTSHGGGTSQA